MKSLNALFCTIARQQSTLSQVRQAYRSCPFQTNLRISSRESDVTNNENHDCEQKNSLGLGKNEYVRQAYLGGQATYVVQLQIGEWTRRDATRRGAAWRDVALRCVALVSFCDSYYFILLVPRTTTSCRYFIFYRAEYGRYLHKYMYLLFRDLPSAIRTPTRKTRVVPTRQVQVGRCTYSAYYLPIQLQPYPMKIDVRTYTSNHT